MGRLKPPLQCPHNRATAQHKNKKKENLTSSRKIRKFIKQQQQLEKSTAAKLNAVHMDPPGGRRRVCRAANVPTAESESSLSPVDADSSNEAGGVGGSSECRRSSRKKTIKFDVRDLLNKNRKSHKIQIEARIDSNAPKVGSGQATREELDSKQKNFIEKSAIFRRYSISENKLPPRPPPPPVSLIQTIQQCVGDLEQPPTDRDIASISPIARTQDILASSMIKPKQVSSLIVTKLESASTTRATPPNRGKPGPPKPPEVHSSFALTSTQLKRRGRPPKFKAPGELLDTTTESSSDSFETSTTLTRGTSAKPSTSRGNPEKDESGSDCREISLSPTSSTKGIDLREMLDASAVTLPQPTILDDCMLVSTDDIFVAAEEEVFTETLSSDESLRSSPKDKSNDEISLFARSNSTETNSSDDSETRRRKVRVSVKRVSLPSIIKESADSNSKHSSDEKFDVIEIFSSNDEDSLRSREEFPKSPKNDDDLCEDSSKAMNTRASRRKLNLTPPAMATEGDNSNSTTLSSIVVISSASATPVDEMLMENAVSPTLRATTNRRARSCKQSEAKTGESKNEGQISEMAFAEVTTTIKPASPTYSQVALRKLRSAPEHAGQATASRKVDVEETDSDQRSYPSPRVSVKSQLDAPAAEVTSPQKQTRTSTGVFTVELTPSAAHLSAKSSKGPSPQFNLSASKAIPHEAASSNQKDASFKFETVGKVQSDILAQNTRSEFASRRIAALISQKPDVVHQSQARDEPDEPDDPEKNTQTVKTRSDLAQGRLDQPQPDRKNAAVALRYRKEGTIANGSEAAAQPSPSDSKVSKKNEQAEGVDSKQNQRKGSSGAIEIKIDLSQSSRRIAASSSRNRSETEQVAGTTQSVEPPTKPEQVAVLPKLSIPVDPLKDQKQPQEKVAPPKICLRSRKGAHEEANYSQAIESGDALSTKSHQKSISIESVPALAVHSQASTRSQRRSAEEAVPSQTTDESVQLKESQTDAVQSAPINSPAVTLQSSGDSSARSTRSRYQKDTQIQATAIIPESRRNLPEATVESDNQQSARLRSRSLVALKSLDREIHSDSAEETVSSQTSGKPAARSARSRSRKKVQSHQTASKSLHRQLERDSSEETGSSEKTVEAPARSSARSKSQKGTASPAVSKSIETVSSPLIPSSEEESQPSPRSRVQKATQSRSARSLSRTRSLRRHAAEEQINSSSESAVSEIGKQKSASPIYQEAVPNVTKEETPSTTTTSESTHRSSTDTSNSGRRESLRAAIRASTSPVKKMTTKRTSKTLPKATANDQTSSSSESSEHQDHMSKGRRQVRSNVGNQSKEETSSVCSESSSTTSSSSTSSSSSASSSSSSSTSSVTTSSSSASEGRATRSRKALEIANGETFERPLQTPPLTAKLPNETVSDAIDKKLRKPEEDFTEPDSESSENSAKIRPKLSSQSSKAEKDCDALFKERAKVVQRRKSIRLNRWAAALEEETNETGSESSETSLPLRRTRSGRSRLRADASETAITVGNNTSENLAEDVPPVEISKENASRCVSDIAAQQSLEQPLADEGKTTGSDAARARSKSKGRRRRFVPINDSSSRSNTFSDDDTSSSGTSSNTRLLRNRSRRKTISGAKELYELLKPTPSTSQSLRHKSTENLREIDDKLPTPVRETQSKAVQPKRREDFKSEVVVQPETEIKSKPEVVVQKGKLVSDVQTTGETANKNETTSEDPARTPKQRKGNRFSLKNATEEVEPQEEISAKPEESPKTPPQRKKAASTSKSPKSFTTTEDQTSIITTSTLKGEAVVSLPGESSPTTRSQRIAQKEAKPSKVEGKSSIHVSSSDFTSISTMGEISSNKVAEEISSKPTVGEEVQNQSVELNSFAKPDANTDKLLRRPHGRSSSSRRNTSSEEDFLKTIESDSIPKVIEKFDANEEKSLAKLPVRSFDCKQSTPVEEAVQKPVEHGWQFISPAEPEDTPDKISEGRSHEPKKGSDRSPEGPSSDTIADSTQVAENLEEANKTAMEGLKIPEPLLETVANTTEAAKQVPFPETQACVEKPHPKKEISPRKKNKTLTKAPDTPQSSEEAQKSKNNKSSTETSTEDEKPVSSESNHSDDSQKTESPSVESKPHTPRRQLDSSFIESLEKSLLRPVSTKKPSKKKDKEPFIVTSPSAKAKEEPHKPKKLQETREEPKKPDTFSPKSKKKQKVEKKPDDDAPTKRKSLTKAKEQPIEAVKSLEPDASSCEIPIAPVIGEPAAEAPPVPASLPKVMKSKGETKFYPVEPVIDANPTPPVAEAPPTVAKEKSPDLLPDPLKDIEKFIEDGVNLLKRGYKLDDDDDTGLDRDILKSDDLVTPKKCKLDDNIEEKKDSSPEDDNSNSNSECSTLATTPTSEIDTPNGIRRSHRIKNSKSTKCLVGRGLVRDKERFSTKDDEKTIYSIDDQKMDLVEVEAKNSKFLKDMEERLSNFRVIRENEYKCERVISKEAKRMLCDCFLTAEEEERGELGCGEDCLNRLLMIECGSDCTVRYRCTNRRFTKFLYSPCRVFRTEKKGFGIMADIEILPGEFIMEYVGEVINGDEFEHRRNVYSQDKNKHYYFMALRSDAIIDATAKGNISRFINHSCDPNAETQKWTVNGELRIGFFSRKSIMPGEEITFDYQYQRYGKEAQKCFCESPNCRGWIGEEPSSEEEEEEEEGESEETEEDEAHEALQLPIVPMPAISTSIIVPDVSMVDQLVPLVPVHSDVTIDKHMDIQPGVAVGSPVAIPSPIIPADVPSVGAPKDIQLKKKKERKRLLDRKEDKIKRREAKQFLEDPDIEDEVRFLVKCGLKNQADTLRLSRLIVRAKLLETRLKLLQILRNGELPCRRLFLDYHGLRLLHGWMSDVVDTRETDKSMEIRMVLLSVLECLPISNKTMLTDSKVYQTVRDWSNNKESHSPSDASPKEATVPSSSSPTVPEDSSCELQKLASKLVNTWDNLPEVFRIPKRERIEQMKEHEREADKGLGQNISKLSGQRNRERFMRNSGPNSGRFKWARSEKDKERERAGDRRRYQQNSNGSGKDDKSVPGESHLSKEQRRELFAAKVARDEAEKRLAEERREFDIKCRFFGLDPKRMRPENMPFCVNPSTGQWYSTDKKPISTPPSYAHVQVPVKPKSTNPEDYRLPPMDLPPLWKFAISPKGKIYYYHVKIRIPQWEPPIKILPLAGQTSAPVKNSESDSSNAEGVDSSEDDIDIIKGLDPVKLQAYIEKKIEDRRLQRYTRLVVEKPISPRKEEDRIYNQMEVRKYKENKEKIRKRKEDIRRRGEPSSKSVDVKPTETAEVDETPANALPIQDFLLSSDEDINIKAECNNSPLIEKIVQGDKIVDELDALHSKRALKRPLAIREKYEHKKRKPDKKESSKSTKRSKDGEGSSSSSKYRKIKEKFRCEIAGIIVHHLKPYRKETCLSGRVLTDDDFNHLARKLTHFVMVKEMKYCESIGQTLFVTESVKNKSREFIKKYMAKYGGVYVRPKTDPEYKEIPFL